MKLFYRLSFWQLPFLHSRPRWETSNPSSQYNFSTDVMQVSAVGVSYCRACNFQVNHGCCFYSKLKKVLANLGPRAGVNDLHFCQHQESRVPIETITFTFCFQRESLCIAFSNTHSQPFPILFHQKVSLPRAYRSVLPGFKKYLPIFIFMQVNDFYITWFLLANMLWGPVCFVAPCSFFCSFCFLERSAYLIFNSNFFKYALSLTVWLHHDGRISVCGFDYSHLLWLFDDLFSQQGKMYALHYACTIAISILSKKESWKSMI